MRKSEDKPKAETKPVWSGNPYDVWNKQINQNDVPAEQRPCIAFGCPLLGSITDTTQDARSTRWYCRHHYLERNYPNGWGEITRRLNMEQPEPPPDLAGPYAGWSPQECQAEIKRILSDTKPGLVAGTFHHVGGRPDMDHKEWARVLRVRHEAGEHLNPMQIVAYKAALGLPEA